MSTAGKTILKPEQNEKMTVSIRRALSESAQTLASNGIEDPRSDSTLLLSRVLQRERVFLFAHPEHTLAPAEIDALRSLIARRAAGEPLQYLTGRQEFFKLDFEVTPDVLIPRPETELIVEVGVEILKDEAGPFFADVGTGSGAIAISLLGELPQARAIAVDVSSRALEVAKRNAERHSVIDRLRLFESDLFSAIDSNESFDLVVSNPPYVSTDDLNRLQREVRYEPRGALEGGPDGFSIIRRLLKDAIKFVRRGGYLVFEIGFGQGEAVELLIDRQVWNLVERRDDLQGIPRTFVLQKN